MLWVIRIATVLTIIGGINWGLVGAFEFNLVDSIFGEGSVASRVIYVLVGVSALITIGNFFRTSSTTDPRQSAA